MTNGNINEFNSSDAKDIALIEKAKTIIFDSIKKTNLDLSNLVILTEASTGNWIFTPFLAAFSNAKKVNCLTRDSRYGQKEQIVNNFSNIAKFFNLDEKIHVYTKRESDIISESDIITNSGLVRPIDTSFINSMKDTAVISLMWEPWEFRPNEINLHECFKKQIPILGVNEHNSILDIMKYDGQAVIKIINDHNIFPEHKKIILVGENLAAFYIFNALKSSGANVFLVTESLQNECKERGIHVIGKRLEDDSVVSHLKDCDAIIINSIPLKREIIGDNGLIPLKLKELSPNVSIFVYYGRVNYEQIKFAGLSCFPLKVPRDGYMGWTVDILGPQPTIELNTLGLKVGEILAKNRLAGKTKFETEKDSLKEPFCLDFSNEQKNLYYSLEN